MAENSQKLRATSKRLIILAGSLFLVTLLVTAIEYKFRSPSGKLAIHIEPLDNQFFLNEEDVGQLITTTFYGKDLGSEAVSDILKEEPLARVNLKVLEKILDEHGWVEDADVFVDAKNNIQIDVRQRRPIVRIFDKNGQSFYLDKNGVRMLPSVHAAARVLVATGSIVDKSQLIMPDSTLYNPVDSILKMALFIQKDTFLNAQIDQIHVEGVRNFTLIPKIGSHKIYFGNLEDMEEKFRKLKIFYCEVLPYEGWRKYRAVNLKYYKQIIGVKN